MTDAAPLIDPENGFIRLPNGGVISPDVALEDFKQNPLFSIDKDFRAGGPGWSKRF